MTDRLNITRQDVCEREAAFWRAGGKRTRASWHTIEGHLMLVNNCAACGKSVLDHTPQCP